MDKNIIGALGAALSIVFISASVGQTAPQNVQCETIPDRQRRSACFQQAGIPVVNCGRPRDDDEATFCRGFARKRQSRSNPQDAKTHPIQLSSHEIDALKQKLYSLWRPPATLYTDPSHLGEYIVTVSIRLNRNGYLAEPPRASSRLRDPLYDAVRESALLAIVNAQPYDMLDQGTYDAWKEIDINFDPRSAPENPASGNRQTTTRSSTISGQAQPPLENGYRWLSVEDFELDGKKLAAEQAKIAMRGAYFKEGQMEYLFVSQTAIMMAKQTFKMDNAVPILTEDARREFRKFLLRCSNIPVGCPVKVFGRVTICEKITLIGRSNLPCLSVDDGSALQ